ncbi:hypothetical protein NIES4073_83290 [Kalymmatonema gypsitolerans NIES-4073]|nr:hypothetical protein NIES4073_83290 [Scytonema sp. NIES-4073]
MGQNSTTGAAFIAGGSLAGAGVSATLGGMGLAGGFGGVGIGTAPVVAAGGVVGAAAYGAFKAIAQGDAVAFGAMGIGAIGGASSLPRELCRVAHLTDKLLKNQEIAWQRSTLWI